MLMLTRDCVTLSFLRSSVHDREPLLELCRRLPQTFFADVPPCYCFISGHFTSLTLHYSVRPPTPRPSTTIENLLNPASHPITMFRAAAGNVFDTAVAKATDENLTSENWEYILVGYSNSVQPLQYLIIGHRMSVTRLARVRLGTYC